MRLVALLTLSIACGSVAAGGVTPQELPGRKHAADACIHLSSTHRFVDCTRGALGMSNGTVKDMQTGVIWLKNANCFGLINWNTATSRAAALADGQCGLADGSRPGDWRLPTLSEWEVMLMVSCYPFPGGPTMPDKTGTACYLTGIPWATNAQSNVYWSSTENESNPGDAWAMDLFSREVNGGTKAFNLYVWPVRSGR